MANQNIEINLQTQIPRNSSSLCNAVHLQMLSVHLTVVKSCKSETSLAGGSNQTFEKYHAATTRWQQTLKFNKVYLPIYGSKLCTHLTGSLRTHGIFISLKIYELVWVVG